VVGPVVGVVDAIPACHLPFWQSACHFGRVIIKTKNGDTRPIGLAGYR